MISHIIKFPYSCITCLTIFDKWMKPFFKKKEKEGRDDVLSRGLQKYSAVSTILLPPSRSAAKGKRQTFNCINNLMSWLLFLSVGIVLQLWKDLTLFEPVQIQELCPDKLCKSGSGRRGLFYASTWMAAPMTTRPPRQWEQPQPWKQCSDGKGSHKNHKNSTKSAQRQFFLQWQLEENRGHFGSLEAHHGAARGDETPRRTSFYYICPKPLALEDPGLLRKFSPLYFH